MTPMATITIVLGVLLTLLGLAGYFLTGTSSFTALIPSVFGLLLLVLGFLARSEPLRKHAMHMAAVVALAGCAGALVPLLRTPAGPRSPVAVFSQAAMVVLTAVFVVLCIRSFRDARRARAGKL
jgi:peptidoglycan/LPS O-acetylase OafA/YrhL